MRYPEQLTLFVDSVSPQYPVTKQLDFVRQIQKHDTRFNITKQIKTGQIS